MPLPPVLITAFTFSSVTFLPFFSLSCLKRPLRDGPIFFSSVSVLWHTLHCSKTSLPLAESPAFWADNKEEASNSAPNEPVHKIQFRIPKQLLGWSDDGKRWSASANFLVYNLRG